MGAHRPGRRRDHDRRLAAAGVRAKQGRPDRPRLLRRPAGDRLRDHRRPAGRQMVVLVRANPADRHPGADGQRRPGGRHVRALRDRHRDRLVEAQRRLPARADYDGTPTPRESRRSRAPTSATCCKRSAPTPAPAPACRPARRSATATTPDHDSTTRRATDETPLGGRRFHPRDAGRALRDRLRRQRPAPESHATSNPLPAAQQAASATRPTASQTSTTQTTHRDHGDPDGLPLAPIPRRRDRQRPLLRPRKARPSRHREHRADRLQPGVGRRDQPDPAATNHAGQAADRIPAPRQPGHLRARASDTGRGRRQSHQPA